MGSLDTRRFYIKGVLTLHHPNDLLLLMKTASLGFPLCRSWIPTAIPPPVSWLQVSPEPVLRNLLVLGKVNEKAQVCVYTVSCFKFEYSPSRNSNDIQLLAYLCEYQRSFTCGSQRNWHVDHPIITTTTCQLQPSYSYGGNKILATLWSGLSVCLSPSCSQKYTHCAVFFFFTACEKVSSEANSLIWRQRRTEIFDVLDADPVPHVSQRDD